MGDNAQAAAVPPAQAEPKFEGFIEYYGHSTLAQGWIFSGWLATAFAMEDVAGVRAHFERGAVEGEYVGVSFPRDDVAGRGQGAHLFVLAPQDHEKLGRLLHLDLTFSGASHRVRPTENARQFDSERVEAATKAILAKTAETAQQHELAVLFSNTGFGAMRPAFNRLSGSARSYHYHDGARGWFVGGAVSRSWAPDYRPEDLVLHFERGDIAGEFQVLFRDGAARRGAEFALFVRGPGRPLGRLLSVEVKEAGVASAIDGAAAVRSHELPQDVQETINGAAAPLRTAFEKLLSLKGAAGDGGFISLGDNILVHIDEVIRYPGSVGTGVFGWLLAQPGVVTDLVLHTASRSVRLDYARVAPIRRRDVIENVGQKAGFENDRCGFFALFPGVDDADDQAYLEIATRRHESAYKSLPAAKLGGMAAIKRSLVDFDAWFSELTTLFENGLGDAVRELNAERVAVRPQLTLTDFGEVNPVPRFSIVVPLYGRIDFVEAQLALLSRNARAASYELLYVLDDPRLRREALRLFDSSYRRFAIPFRAVLLDQNRGFAGASNIGLAQAKGRYVCFLNSDVFPRSDDWLERLGARLEETSDLGAVGPALLYEDGTVQHEGMNYRRLPEFGNWLYCTHPRKGMRRSTQSGLQRRIAITGACMVMQASLARDLGGFDENYINDFEDADLCLKVHKKGLACAVDFDVELYHLERKSHPGSAQSWSRNLVYYNAWLHNERWEKHILAHPLFSETVPTVSLDQVRP